MRVLQVDAGRTWRGNQDPVLVLCRELLGAADVEQTLVTRQDSELAQRAAAAGISVLATAWEIGLDPRAWWHLRRTITSFQPDVIHIHDSHALTLAATVALGRKIVATRRVELHIGRFGSWRRPDRIIAVAESVKRVLVEDQIDSDAVAVVHDGIDIDAVRRAATPPQDIRRELGIPAGAPVAVTAAVATTPAEQRALLRTTEYAHAKRPELHWIVLGNGSDTARLKSSSQVHVVSVDRMEAVIGASDVFVGIGASAGGSPLLTALALDRPVVATATAVAPEILPAVALVPVNQADTLAQRVVDVLQQPSVIPFPVDFTAREMADAVLDVYATLL